MAVPAEFLVTTLTATGTASSPTSRVAIIHTAWKRISPRADLCLCHPGNTDRAVAVSVGGDLTVATLRYQNAELTRRVMCEQDSGRARFARVHEICTPSPIRAPVGEEAVGESPAPALEDPPHAARGRRRRKGDV